MEGSLGGTVATVHRSWQRKHDEKDGFNVNGDDKEEITKSESFKSINKELSVSTEATTENGESTNTDDGESNVSDQMKRIGRNKLVLKKEVGKRSTRKKVLVSVAKVDVTNMKRCGNHKLVLQKKNNEIKSLAASSNNVATGTVPEGMKTTGHNKLVSEARYLQDEEQWKERLKKRRIESSRGRANRLAKRIKLTEVMQTNTGETPKKQTFVEKLSDFAYQKTSKQRSGSKQNMGLVRVANAEDAPICSTFARGLPCTNLRCTKRHDVPIEASTPICSYFQRSGQCLRRDTCPFRHIKVNPHAMICSSFSLLGYCEKEDCVMKHIRVWKNQVKELES
eukprot:CAMPEP_0194217658 /NCGR_PEP_ID=MMETSP0156-20130528/21908_1 /TAXON_ID=33649 /ORGANISM="Thalassionema nitzschioides, Strain L26-B" /LENGTH=336 /DNA_ID=CAMNT_0038946767 /DNA_START=124 /DNA_END=1134 /DNA_ORIENTATION=+